MKRRINVSIALKNDGRITQARVNLTQDILEVLNISEKEKSVIIEYKDKIMKIMKCEPTERLQNEIIKKGNDLIFFKIKKNILILPSGKDQKYHSYKLSIPLTIIDDLKINKNSNEVELEISPEKAIKIKKIEKGDDIIMEENKRKQGVVIDVKIEKGGTGKTFVSAQIIQRLASYGKKILAITSDPQNNLIHHLTSKTKGIKNWKTLLDGAEGLEKWILKNEGDLIKVKDNIHFIPVKGSNFSWQVTKKFPAFIEKMREIYDFIIIDSTPIPLLDKIFVEASDKIIIPVFPDETTVQGAIGIIKEAGVEKILAIILNRYSNKKIQNKYKQQIEEAIEETDILYSVINDLSEVQYVIDMGKSVWDYKSKNIKLVQKELDKIVDEILNPGSNLKIRNELDFDDFDL